MTAKDLPNWFGIGPVPNHGTGIPGGGNPGGNGVPRNGGGGGGGTPKLALKGPPGIIPPGEGTVPCRLLACGGGAELFPHRTSLKSTKVVQ